jgi:hypothetical protein
MATHGAPGPALSGRAWGVALVVLGLLLFTWPFVRSPRLGVVAAWLHLFAVWLAVIAASWATSRALGRGGRDA